MVIKSALLKSREILKNADTESWLADSRILLCHFLNCSSSKLILREDEELPPETEKLFFDAVALRAKKMPVKYITGICEFMGYEFHIEKGVLIPRPKTRRSLIFAAEAVASVFLF